MSQRKILVVDDDHTVRDFIGTCLRKSGFAVLEAEHGVEAVLMASGQPIDLVITDVVMPGMNGVELAAYLSQYTAHKFLIISGYPNESVKPVLQSGRSVGFLAKPFTAEVLMHKVREALGEVS